MCDEAARLGTAGMFALALIATTMVLCAGTLAAAQDRQSGDLRVAILSSAPGNLFTDSEPASVRVRVSGADGAVTVRFEVAETDGPWRNSGRLSLDVLPDGTAEEALPLELPGRGLYKVNVTAVFGQKQAHAETWVAIVFTPEKPVLQSPWGIFWVPDRGTGEALAKSIRLLGASWVRFNFWAFSFDEVTVTDGPVPVVKAKYSRWKRYAQALHDEGLFIMGEIAQCPKALSSKADAVTPQGDSGPIWARVKPRDYRLWDQLMEQLAADFSDEIDVWEIWNEPNIHFWEGTVEEYAELVEHTARALRRGNPDTRIAAGGFVAISPGAFGFTEKLLQLGMGKHIDVLSVHYTDEQPEHIAQWRELLAKHELDLPIWNSEEKSEIPLRNLAGGIEISFKFIHIGVRYPEYRPLVRPDLTVLPAGMAFSVAAHCIGVGEHVGSSDVVPGFDVHFFRRGEETVGVFQRATVKDRTKLFGPKARRLTLAVEPLEGGGDVVVTDIFGRSRALPVSDGRAVLSLESALSGSSSTPGALFVNGARAIEVVSIDELKQGDGTSVFTAESGRRSVGWGVFSEAGYFGDKVASIWADKEPGPEGYWVEVDIAVGRSGRYQVIFSGNDLKRMKSPRSLSPFQWRIDDGQAHTVDASMPPPTGDLGAIGGLNDLGDIHLDKGKHRFRLTLTGRRDEPDQRYALWFDAILLRLQSE